MVYQWYNLIVVEGTGDEKVWFFGDGEDQTDIVVVVVVVVVANGLKTRCCWTECGCGACHSLGS